MSLILSTLALFLILVATGGFIVFVIKQRKSVYIWSFRTLLAGFAALTVQLTYDYSVLGAAPVLSFKTALSFFAWSILGAYVLLHLKFRLMVLGSFVSPLAAFLMILSSTLPVAEVVVRPVFAFMAALMYLIQESQIKRKRFGSLYSRLPSLQTLDSINHYSLMYGFALLTVGMMTGAFFAQIALGRYWRWDPKEVWSLITWLFYAVLLHERLAVGWRGRRAAILSILAFLVLLFTFLGIGLWMSDYHSFKSLGGVREV
jgi:ABC-type transport system involved in cytochrome c biogenesis permease subunit